MGPHKRIRRIEFAPLPKTISGKIRRVELRVLEDGGAPMPVVDHSNIGKKISWQ